MGRCRTTREAKANGSESSLAKALAPEEIRRGDFVTALYVISEWPSWYWNDCESGHARDEIVRLCTVPTGEPSPLKVLGVCLPYVLVRTTERAEQTIDVRRWRLARLERRFGRRAWRAGRKASRRQKASGAVSSV